MDSRQILQNIREYVAYLDSMESTWNPGAYVFQCFWFCSSNKIVRNLRKFDMIDELKDWRVTYCYFDKIQ